MIHHFSVLGVGGGVGDSVSIVGVACQEILLLLTVTQVLHSKGVGMVLRTKPAALDICCQIRFMLPNSLQRPRVITGLEVLYLGGKFQYLIILLKQYGKVVVVPEQFFNFVLPSNFLKTNIHKWTLRPSTSAFPSGAS